MQAVRMDSWRLPMVHVGGQDYFVDFKLREFRSPGDRFRAAEFIRFDGPKGQAIWEQFLIAACSGCGAIHVEPRYASNVRCRQCGHWVLV